MFEIIQGNLEPDMPLTVTVNGIAQDLTAATSTAFFWVKPDGTTSTVSLTAVTLATGQLKRVWAAGDTAITGYHRGRVVVTWPSTETQTFPNDGSWYYWAVFSATP